MDPYHHHHHHHRLSHGPTSNAQFESSALPASSRFHDRHGAPTARAAGHPQMGPGLAISFPLQTAFTRSQESGSTSPGDAVPPVTDPFAPASTSAAHASQSSGSTPNPKRAYRQRRKDPSCDACRERKVKCDATETASCSECSSRNVRCQFTKETNRRMSSIKQFQDLERQLRQKEQQLAHYRSIVPQAALTMDTDRSSSPSRHGQDLPPRRRKPAVFKDFSQVRSNLMDYGRGLLQIPSPYREVIPQTKKSLEMPDLPPRQVANRLLALYHQNFHMHFPILHWPTFESECEQLYRTNSFASLGHAWNALFLCVLACGTLHNQDPSPTVDGKAFLSKAIGMTDRLQDEFSVQEARMAFLTGVFLIEINLKSAGWVWLGSAVRVSQDLGLHVESGPWSSTEGDIRRRLWYCIYAWDRLMALELGKPLLVHDEDYDTEYPEPAEEEQIKSNGEHSTEQFTPLSTIVRVVRSFQSLVELRKSSYIPRETLLSREDYLCTFFSSFPKTFQPSSSGFLDPRAIGPLVCLQNARLLLQRHNLTPACPSELRLEAIDNCVMVARDTATILSRCLDPSLSPKQAPAERSRVLATSASTLLCMHVWRCLLFLLFRRHYHPALVLVQAASAIGGARPVNLCCGRHVEFFLRLLYSRRQQGHSADLDEDEEMIAYVSGDLQSDPYASWVWQARDSGIDLRNLAKTVPGLPSFDQVRSGLTNNVKHTALTDPERKEWSGWEKVEREIRFLHEQQQIQQQQLPSRLSQQQAPSSSPSDTSRMTIANII